MLRTRVISIFTYISVCLFCNIRQLNEPLIFLVQRGFILCLYFFKLILFTFKLCLFPVNQICVVTLFCIWATSSTLLSCYLYLCLTQSVNKYTNLLIQTCILIFHCFYWYLIIAISSCKHIEFLTLFQSLNIVQFKFLLVDMFLQLNFMVLCKRLGS